MGTKNAINRLVFVVADAKKVNMMQKAPYIEKAIDEQININLSLLNTIEIQGEIIRGLELRISDLEGVQHGGS